MRITKCNQINCLKSVRLFATRFSPSKFYFWPKTEIIKLAIQALTETAAKKGDKKKRVIKSLLLLFFSEWKECWTFRFSVHLLSLLKFFVLLFTKQLSQILFEKQSEIICFNICLENAGHLIAIILNLSFTLFSHFVSNGLFSRKICLLLKKNSAFTSFYWRAALHKSYFESMKNSKYQIRRNASEEPNLILFNLCSSYFFLANENQGSIFYQADVGTWLAHNLRLCFFMRL